MNNHLTIGGKGIKDGVDALRVISHTGDALDIIKNGQRQDVGQEMKDLHSQGKGKGLTFDGTSIQG